MCEEQEILKDAWLACAVSALVPGNKFKTSRVFSSPQELVSLFIAVRFLLLICVRISFSVEVRDIN